MRARAHVRSRSSAGCQRPWRRVTNWFLFKLQRHSDHHVHATRPYHVLRIAPAAASPRLPLGYAGMILLSLVPAAGGVFRTCTRTTDVESEGDASACIRRHQAFALAPVD